MPDHAITTTSNPPVPRQTPGAITSQPIATPTHGAGGSFSIISSRHIAASPDIAFAVLLEHSTWPAWNRFVRRVTISAAPSSSSSSSSSSPPLSEALPDAPPTSASASASASALQAAIAIDDGQRYLKQGTRMTFQVHLDPDNAKSYTMQGMEVTLLEPIVDVHDDDNNNNNNNPKGWRIAWKGTSIPALLLRTERVQEFVDDGHGGTEYTCWETMYGPLAPVVRLTTGKSLEKGFAAWGVDLAARAEQVAKEGGSPLR